MALDSGRQPLPIPNNTGLGLISMNTSIPELASDYIPSENFTSAQMCFRQYAASGIESGWRIPPNRFELREMRGAENSI